MWNAILASVIKLLSSNTIKVAVATVAISVLTYAYGLDIVKEHPGLLVILTGVVGVLTAYVRATSKTDPLIGGSTVKPTKTFNDYVNDIVEDVLARKIPLQPAKDMLVSLLDTLLAEVSKKVSTTNLPPPPAV